MSEETKPRKTVTLREDLHDKLIDDLVKKPRLTQRQAVDESIETFLAKRRESRRIKS